MAYAFVRSSCMWTCAGLLVMAGTAMVNVLAGGGLHSTRAAMMTILLQVPSWVALVFPLAAYAGGLAMASARRRDRASEAWRAAARMLLPAIVGGLFVFVLLGYVAPLSEAMAGRIQAGAPMVSSPEAETRPVLRERYRAEVQIARDNPRFTSIGWSPSWSTAYRTGFVYHLQVMVALLASVCALLGYFIGRISSSARMVDRRRHAADAWACGALLGGWYLATLILGMELSTQLRIPPVLTSLFVVAGPALVTVTLAWASARTNVDDE